jgi:hypothetical protein
MDKSGGHEDLRDSDCWSVTPYVHGESCCVCVSKFAYHLSWPFIDQVRSSYTVTQGLTCGPGVIWSLFYRVLPTRVDEWCLQRCESHRVLSSRHVACMRSVAPGCRVTRHCSGPTAQSCRATLHCSDPPWVGSRLTLHCCSPAPPAHMSY